MGGFFWRFNMAKKSFPMWIYHANEQAKIIDSADMKEHEKLGWKDSPAKCKEKKSK